jgi:hypothetical protein
MTRATEAVVRQLAAGLRPVRRAASPWAWAGAWLGVVSAAGLLLASRVDLGEVARRLSAAPDMWLAVAGSVWTALGAGLAAFLVGRPDRSVRWAWLPVPGLVLWQAANGLGCLRADVAGLRTVGFRAAAGDCLPFILVTSAPLAAVLILMLRRVPSLRPGLTLWMGGLAVAAAAASLLWLDHPFDAGVSDLLVHALAVALVVVAVRAMRRLAG